MKRIKTGITKKSFMREHECRFCLYYTSCAHKQCVFDGSDGSDRADHNGRETGVKRGAFDSE